MKFASPELLTALIYLGTVSGSPLKRLSCHLRMYVSVEVEVN